MDDFDDFDDDFSDDFEGDSGDDGNFMDDDSIEDSFDDDFGPEDSCEDDSGIEIEPIGDEMCDDEFTVKDAVILGSAMGWAYEEGLDEAERRKLEKKMDDDMGVSNRDSKP
ncbi:MAG: hypothetical protein ABIH23_03675 [bacterium]